MKNDLNQFNYLNVDNCCCVVVAPALSNLGLQIFFELLENHPANLGLGRHFLKNDGLLAEFENLALAAFDFARQFRLLAPNARLPLVLAEVELA